MKPATTLFSLSLSALVLGSGCTADRPAGEAPDPAPAARIEPQGVLPRAGALAPPPSASHGAVLVWDRIRESGADAIRLRRLECRTVDGGDDRPDRVHVKVDLTVDGSDAIQATARYVTLLDDLSASSWCANVKRAPTRVLDSQDSLEVVGLEVLVRPTAVVWDAGLRDEDPELVARGLAAELGLGGLDSRTSSRQPARLVTDTITHIRPSDRRRAYELATILAFVTALEDRTPNRSVTGAELKPIRRSRVAEPQDQWTFQVQLSSRSATQP